MLAFFLFLFFCWWALVSGLGRVSGCLEGVEEWDLMTQAGSRGLCSSLSTFEMSSYTLSHVFLVPVEISCLFTISS